ncbi:MAG: hypothetical protein Q9183_004959, partial [Haloplaca sp. 2 TL-2023]
MANVSVPLSDEKTQLGMVQILPNGKADDKASSLKLPELDASNAIMDDLNFIMFGDPEETNTADALGIATIHWSK